MAIYEGKVEVKTKDGQVTTVSSKGDKPEVVVISQKLSLAKLAVAGLVSAVALGGTIFFLKRKFFAKKAGKKK